MVIFIIAILLFIMAVAGILWYIAAHNDFISHLTDDDIKDDDWIV